MFRSLFFWKLYSGYAFLILLTTTVLILTVTPTIEKESLKGIEKALLAKAELLRSLAATRDLDLPASVFQERIRDLGKRTETRITVVHLDGVVLADSDEDPAVMDNHRDRPEILAAWERGKGTAIRFSETLRREMMYLALPIRREGETIGFVRAALPLTVIDQRLTDFRRTVLLDALVAAAVGVGLGFLFTRHTTRPLTAMTEQAQILARDHTAAPVPAGRKDEIGTLARSFNAMAAELRARFGQIQQDQTQLLAILSAMKEGVVAIDREERIVHLNGAAGRILGIEPEKAVGRPLWESTRVGGAGQILSRVLREGAEITDEVRWSDSTREQVIQIHASPLQDAGEGLAGAVALLHDVTELRRLERVRRDFVANVSHELRTPVTAIRGLVETLLEEGGRDPKLLRRFLEKTRRQAERLSSLLADLFTLSRFESPEFTGRHQPLDLREVMTGVHQAFAQEAEARNIRLDLELPPAAVTVLGDEQSLRQAVGNLVDNALKYTPAEGRIRIGLESRPPEAWLDVRDTGIGIRPADQKRIFERFYRVDKARSREVGGTGLGLSIVKHVASAHGGEVAVESALGAGSRFRIRLPLSSS